MNPILVETYRQGVLESFQRGVVCVVDREGEIIYSEGDVHQICYPRSAMKLLQVLPMLESGAMEHFDFTLEEIAVMCGSHNGEPEHQRVVTSILEKAGLTKDALRCGAQYPTDKETSNELIRKGQKPHAIHNNCSGKHAGFLAYCVYQGWSTEDYINPSHPAQQEILSTVAEMYKYPADKMVTALDGCSAPIFSVPVYNQALGYKNLVEPSNFPQSRQDACYTVIEAVSRYPHMVAGNKRYCTDMLQVCAPHIIGKTGAEGVYSLGLTVEKIGVAIKIDDGKQHAQYHVAQRFIEATGLFSEEQLLPLKHYERDEIKNFNKFITGELKTRDGLFDTLKIVY
ncbi:MAG TPA: asparaginase [Bacteroidia bacterium]|nr:asparaginase [Bacteroidia bacterium]